MKRHPHCHVHCSTIHSSQTWTPPMPIHGRMCQARVRCAHHGMLFRHTKEQSLSLAKAGIESQIESSGVRLAQKDKNCMCPQVKSEKWMQNGEEQVGESGAGKTGKSPCMGTKLQQDKRRVVTEDNSVLHYAFPKARISNLNIFTVKETINA